MTKRRTVNAGLGLALSLLTLGVIWGSNLAHAEAKIEPIQEIFEPTAPSISENYGKAAVIQWASYRVTPLGVSAEQAEAYKMGNRRMLENYIREAARNGAKLVVTPEFSIVNYPDVPELPDEEDNFRNRDDIRPYVETVPGPTTDYFGRIARELGIFLHVGFAEVDPATNAYYNTVVALNPQGEIVARYRKINLYQKEKDFLSRGTSPSLYDSPFGKIGLIICADVYSTFPMQNYRRLGVDVLALSTSWAQPNTGMEFFQNGARRTGAFMLAANQNYYPDSGVINPDGSLQSHIRQTTGIAYGYLPYRRPARR